MSHLFEELIEEILLKLPVKSLLRCRCVSKSWSNLIDSEDFINMHLQHSIKTNTNLHLIFTTRNSSSLDLYLHSYSTDFDDDDQILNKLVTATKLNFLNKTMSYKEQVFGSCNGLLCLSDFRSLHYNLSLVNPFSRKWKCLPTAHVGFENFKSSQFMAHIGFGYDPVNNDYKVIRIVRFFDLDDALLHNPFASVVHVYSSRFDSWRRIQDLPYTEYLFRGNPSCSVSSASHWLMYKPTGGLSSENFVVAFDYGDEEFRIVRHGRSKEFLNVENLGGRLCIFEKADVNCVDVWVMKEYGKGESWYKLHSFKIAADYWFLDNGKPWALSKNGDKLLVQSDSNTFQWHDLKLKEEAEDNVVSFQGILEKVYLDKCYESLVSP